ncbi:MAG TPA: amino acid adenylation domain-containing protein, partial [Actinoplanes sp.]
LLTAALAEPETPLRALPLLDPAERSVLRGPATVLPSETVVDLIARQVDRAPEAVAVIADGTTVSYGELAERAGRMATRLLAADVRPGAVVAVCASPSPDQVVALVGVLLAGARYLPLDPDHPADRLAYLLTDSGAAVVLADPAGAERLPDLGRRAVAVLPLQAVARPAPFAGVARTSDPAYVMYTSGSTGRPKGVAVPHRALVNLLLDMRDRLGCGPDAVWLALTSLSFDISLLELLLPLISGARLVVAPGGSGRDGAQVVELIDRHRVTHVQATPSGWQVLVAAGLHEPRLTALAGGEALPLALAADLRGRVGRLWNVYGPTETTIWSTAWPVPPAPDRIRIGAPLANTGVHVVDPDGTPVPVGVSGELYLSGAGLADGYLRRPELTAERFVVHDGVRCYRTGDRVRRDADGLLEFLGRFDRQVKVRGHRIEPGEVEAALATHPGVGGVAVLLAGDELAGDELAGDELVAYLVPATGAATPTPRELQAHVAPVLPRALHPDRYVVLGAFPLTPDGKLDRAALPAPGAVPGAEPPTAPAGDGQPSAGRLPAARRTDRRHSDGPVGGGPVGGGPGAAVTAQVVAVSTRSPSESNTDALITRRS